MVDRAEVYPDSNIERPEIIEHVGLHVVFHFDRCEITASQPINQFSSMYCIRELQVSEPDIEESNRIIYEERLLVR